MFNNFLSQFFYRQPSDCLSKRRAEEQRQIEEDAKVLLDFQTDKLDSMLVKQDTDLRKDRDARKKLKEAYLAEAEKRKTKHTLQNMQSKNGSFNVSQQSSSYAIKIMIMQTDDSDFFKYQLACRRMIQKFMMESQIMPVSMSLFIYLLTKRLKSKSDMDIFYFIVPYVYTNYGQFLSESRLIFEKGFPANKTVMGLRRDVIMKSAYDYPAIVKNEIEYMHYKLHKFDQDSDLLENPKYLRETRYQKHFQMGEIAGKYQQMLQDQTGLDLKNNKIKKQPQKRRFEVVVEGGQVYFKCIDKFEEIFEISQEALGGQPIVEVLDPFTFDNHKEIIDALFEVYHDLSEQYLESGKPQSQDAIEGNLFEKATKKLRIKHGLVDDNSVQKPNSQLQIDTKTALKDELDAQKLASFKE